MKPRLEKLRQTLTENKLDLMLVSTPENRRYLSGFTGSAGYLLISPKEAILATDFRYVEQASIQAPDFQILRIGGDYDWFPKAVSEVGTRRVGFESQHVTVAQFQQLKEALGGLPKSNHPSLVTTSGLVEGLRAVKDADELALMQQAIDIADQAFVTVASNLRPGLTERQVAWELEKTMRELGADGPSFETIVAAGPNGALPHHRPTDTPIQQGEPIVIDMGARYRGYCSDMTRTVCLGNGSDTFRKVFDTVLTAQETAIATIQAKMTAGEADSLARNIIQEAGYGDAFGHSLGHGIGLAVHEFPRVGPNSSAVLEEGMVFTVEPGIYLSGWGGVRIEDMVVLEKGRTRVLGKAPKGEHPGG